MNSLLSIAGYEQDSETGVYCRPGYQGINYSDGDEVENRLATIITSSSDLSVLSAELRRQASDWPSLYHLSGSRANILRPFEHDLRGDILEIGAGCGAITRYLGECGGRILALEGTMRRAAIARARTRELENVTVVSDSFELFRIEKQFDVITLIGVLEYANLFIERADPVRAMLERVRSFLKPGGKLFIAIENQLGLKYFAGAPEDHIGVPMYGVEGRYTKSQPQTFGKKALQAHLSAAGFSASEFLAPFPDYKFPISIVSERGMNDPEFDAAAFAWQSVRRDPQLPPVLAFSPEFVWPTLVENGLALDLANSFLVVASAAPLAEVEELAWHFTTERKAEYCKVTRFVRASEQTLEARYHSLADYTHNHSSDPSVTLVLSPSAPYIVGRPLSFELLQICSTDGWRREEVVAVLVRYLQFVLQQMDSVQAHQALSNPHFEVPGRFFDCIPQNVIQTGSGTLEMIDNEWSVHSPLSLGFLIFRSVLSLSGSITRLGRCRESFTNSWRGFIRFIGEGLGWSLTEAELETFARLEFSFQQKVSSRMLSLEEYLASLNAPIVNYYNLSQAASHGQTVVSTVQRIMAETLQQMEGLNENECLALRERLLSLQSEVERLEGGVWGYSMVQAQQLAHTYCAELKNLQTHFDAMQSAKEQAEALAFARFDEIKTLSENLLQMEQAKSAAEQYAFRYLAELQQTREKLAAIQSTVEDSLQQMGGGNKEQTLSGKSCSLSLQSEKMQAQQLAPSDGAELKKLQTQFDAMQSAKERAEELAFRRLDEIQTLSENLGRMEQAKSAAEQYAFGYLAELQRTQEQLAARGLKTPLDRMEGMEQLKGSVVYQLLAALKILPRIDRHD